jgi:hypothetical protein
MDGNPARWLFDPDTTRALVLTRRPPAGRPVEDVVSDVVWGEVVGLLRWAVAGANGPADLRVGTWWRLAAGCAALLRRLPGLTAEIAQPWAVVPPPTAPDAAPTERVAAVAGRLAALLRSDERVPLPVLAAEVDALGEAAVQAIAARSLDPWTGDA